MRTALTVLADACDEWGVRPPDIVLHNGSRAEGLGNADSDVDFWVVSDGESEAAGRVPVFDWREGYHLNCSAYTTETLHRLAALINAIAPDDYQTLLAMRPNNLDRYYRVVSAVPVMNADGLEALRAGRFDRGHCQSLLVAWAGIRSRTHLAEAQAALADGDGLLATVLARRAFEFGLDSHLALHGEAFPSLKWRYEKLARLAGAESNGYQTAWALKACGERTPAVYVAAVTAWCEGAGVLAFPAVRVPVQPSPGAGLFEVDGTPYLVRDRAYLYRTDAATAQLWRTLTERRAAEGAGEDREAAASDPLVRCGLLRYITDTVL